jgi:2-oxoglutarate ferredoxin oxidoreductase subunit delta
MPLKGRIVVSEKYCKGCELCIAACPQGVMAVDMDHLNSKGYHPAALVSEGCTGCAICALVCPEAAITVYREPVRAKATAQEAMDGA